MNYIVMGYRKADYNSAIVACGDGALYEFSSASRFTKSQLYDLREHVQATSRCYNMEGIELYLAYDDSPDEVLGYLSDIDSLKHHLES